MECYWIFLHLILLRICNTLYVECVGLFMAVTNELLVTVYGQPSYLYGALLKLVW